MKKYTYILYLTIIFYSCNSKQENDINYIINSNDLKLIQSEKTKVSNEINSLEDELKKLNNAIIILDKNQKFPLVTNSKLESKPFSHFIKVQGALTSDKNLNLYPEIPGIIRTINVKEGQKVVKGTILVELSNEGAKAQLEQMKLQVKLAKTIYERQLNLWNQKIGSEIQFLQAETNYLSLKKNIDQLNDQIMKSKIIAPFDGIIDELIADPGSNVSPGISPILRIINLDEIKVKAEVPEIHIDKIKKYSEVLVFIPTLSTTVNAKISSVGNVINPSNRNFRIEIILKNSKNNFKPNMTAKILIKDYENTEALLVSEKNIIEDSNNNFYVFKLEPNILSENKYQVIKTFVKLGKISDNKIEVLEGLKNGDLIIEDGIRLVQDKQIVKSLN
tara:strand:- start:892 stop:2061 length:1170 start_codon:yes stop_codon:yes gene_type:complete